MNIEEIVKKIYDLRKIDNTEEFYNNIDEIMDNAGIKFEFERKDDENYKRTIRNKLFQELSINLNNDDKEKFFDLIKTRDLAYCVGDEQKLEQVKKREEPRALMFLEDDDIKMQILEDGELNGEKIDKKTVYYLISALKDDNKKLKSLDKYRKKLSEEDLDLIIDTIQDDIKMQLLEDGEFNGEKIDINRIHYLISSLKDDNKKLKSLDKYRKKLSEEDLDLIIATIQDENVEKSARSMLENERIVRDKLEKKKMEDYKIALLSKEEDKAQKIKIIKELSGDESKIFAVTQIMQDEVNGKDIIEIIKTLDDDKSKMLLIDRIKEEEMPELQNDLSNIGNQLKNDESKIYVIDIIEKYTDKYVSDGRMPLVEERKKSIVMTFNSDENKLRYIEDFSREDTKLELITSLKDGKLMIDELIKRGKIEKFLGSGIYRNQNGLKIKEGIDSILKYYGFSSNLEEKKQLLERMEKNNSKLYNTINFEILNDKYVQTFNEEQLNILSNFFYEQKFLTQFSDGQLETTKNMMEYLKNNNLEDDFREYFSSYLKVGNTYKELSENIAEKNLSDEDMEKVYLIMQYKNSFNIKNLEDVRNFENIKNSYLEGIINNEESTAEELRDAVIWKKFGMDYEAAKRLATEFSDKAKEDESIKLLKSIVGLNVDEDVSLSEESKQILRSIYENENIKDVTICDRINLRKNYKKSYEQELNETLFSIDENTTHSVIDGIKVYEPDSNFSMIMTAIGGPRNNVRMKEFEGNKKDNWNRLDYGTEHFCASYIRNDMLGCCDSLVNVYYGFSSMPEGSLMFMCLEDMQSNIGASLTSSINGIRKFDDPTQLINNTGKGVRGDFYNEIDIKRMKNGKRLQPDYLILFEKNKKFLNLQETLEAQKDWEGLPIVRIDIDKYLQQEIQKLNEMIEFNKADLNDENIQNIWNKYHNLTNSIRKWCEGKEIEEILSNIKLPPELEQDIVYTTNKCYSKRERIANQQTEDEHKVSKEYLEEYIKTHEMNKEVDESEQQPKTLNDEDSSKANIEINEDVVNIPIDQDSIETANHENTLNDEDSSKENIEIDEDIVNIPINQDSIETTNHDLTPAKIDETKLKNIYKKARGRIRETLDKIKSIMNKSKNNDYKEIE